MRSFLGLGLVAAMALVVLATTGGAPAQPTSQPAPRPGGITMLRPPMEFPAVGNIEAVREWKLGRVERLERRSGTNDVLIGIRTPDDRLHEIIAPREPVAFLIRQCGWLSTPTQTFASQSDYAERMIAFDADASGRLIAIMSLEPFPRNQARMRRAFCN